MLQTRKAGIYVKELCHAMIWVLQKQEETGEMLIAAYVIDGMAKPFKINQPISPVRIRKLVRSSYIVPAYLKKHGYPYQYTFHQAFEDWKRNQPGDWMAE